MSKFKHSKIVDTDKGEYVVIPFKFKDQLFPVIIDKNIYKIVNKLDKKWYVNDRGCIYYIDKTKESNIYLHELIKIIDSSLNKTVLEDKAIIHLNRIPFDNRIENLSYDTIDKKHKKNLKKKKRTATLPKSSGIKISDLPTFMWYIKNNDSHGDRFFISVDDIRWKSTSSKKISLRYKLEESKKYLRDLRETRPDIFTSYSMNGDFTEIGNILLKEYFIIAKNGGFNDLRMFTMNKNTDKFLCENTEGLCTFEKTLLEKFDVGGPAPNIKSEFDMYKKDNIDIYVEKIPEFCYYAEGTKYGNDYFYIKNHPQCKKWIGTKDISASTKTKFTELINKITSLG
jgi:hypothetical protein